MYLYHEVMPDRREGMLSKLMQALANGNVTLIRGEGNYHGDGVYFSTNGRYFNTFNSSIVTIRLDTDHLDDVLKMRLVNLERYEIAFFEGTDGVNLKGHYVDTPAPNGGRMWISSGEARNIPYEKALVLAKFVSAPPPTKSLGGRYRLLGIILGLATFIYGRLSNRLRWIWLGHFLLALGGKRIVPASVVEEGLGDLARHDYNKDGSHSVRPKAHTELFWIVGTMTVVDDGQKVVGEDIYDFHPQVAQRTILRAGKRPGGTWAWSGGEDDSVRIPVRYQSSRVTLNLEKLGKRFFPLLFPKYIRKKKGYLLFSNNLWNALGGKPFTSVVEAPRRDYYWLR